jgi:type II secretory pathway pseudopilin PulG
MPASTLEPLRGARGCSLIEVLVAISIFAAAVVSLAQLTGMATSADLQAGRTSFAAVIAQQKIEELLAASPAIDLSPAGALTNSLNGWFDFVDGHGRTIGTGASPPVGSDYLRRWSVEPVSDSDTLVVRVLVTDIRNAMSVGVLSPRANQVRLVAARSRQAF